MAKKLLDSKLLYVILSVILAIALWYYVTTAEGVTATETISNIAISCTGEDILMSKGLMLTSELPDVSMTFEATAATLVRLKQQGAVSLSLDVSSVTQPGNYTMSYEVAYSGVSRNDFSVVEQTPVSVSFVVERYVTEEVDIRGQFIGQVADGYTITLENNQPTFEFTPEHISVSGLKSDVDRIAYALVTIADEELSETVSGEFAYQLIGIDGEVLDQEELDIECSSETVETVLRVQMYAEIPLTVTFADGGGITEEDNVTWDIDPKSVTVAGEEADVSALLARGMLSVAAIDLASITADETVLTCTIPLAEELTNVDGVSEATITINVSGAVSTTLQVTEFDIQNVPDGYVASVQTKSLNVMVRGTEEELELVSAENLRVVADLTDFSLGAGQYTVNAKIYFDGIGKAGVVKLDYPLTVRLTQQ